MIWHVYGVIDLNTSETFYIGCSRNLWSARQRHMYDSASAVCQTGRRPFEIRTISSHGDLAGARAEEARLIRSTPGLINRAHGLGYRRMGPPGWWRS